MVHASLWAPRALLLCSPHRSPSTASTIPDLFPTLCRPFRASSVDRQDRPEGLQHATAGWQDSGLWIQASAVAVRIGDRAAEGTTRIAPSLGVERVPSRDRTWSMAARPIKLPPREMSSHNVAYLPALPSPPLCSGPGTEPCFLVWQAGLASRDFLLGASFRSRSPSVVCCRLSSVVLHMTYGCLPLLSWLANVVLQHRAFTEHSPSVFRASCRPWSEAGWQPCRRHLPGSRTPRRRSRSRRAAGLVQDRAP